MKRSPKEISDELIQLEEDAYKIWSKDNTDMRLVPMSQKHEDLRDELGQHGQHHFTLSMVLDIMETKELLSKSKISPGTVSMSRFEQIKYKLGHLTRDAIKQVEAEGNAIKDPATRNAFFSVPGMWSGNDDF